MSIPILAQCCFKKNNKSGRVPPWFVIAFNVKNGSVLDSILTGFIRTNPDNIMTSNRLTLTVPFFLDKDPHQEIV